MGGLGLCLCTDCVCSSMTTNRQVMYCTLFDYEYVTVFVNACDKKNPWTLRGASWPFMGFYCTSVGLTLFWAFMALPEGLYTYGISMAFNGASS